MPARPGQPKGDAGRYQRKPKGKPALGEERNSIAPKPSAVSTALDPKAEISDVLPLFDTFKQPKPADSWFDEDAAQHVIGFITGLRHYQGRHAAEAFVLLPWEEKIIRELFGWKRADGRRLYRKAYVELPRKTGKTTLAAAIALYLAFDDNEPGAQVFFAATDRDQASMCYGTARIMAEDARERGLLPEFVPYNSSKRIIIPSNPGAELKALSSDTKKLYGLNLHGLIFDELMAQPNRVMWDALTTAQGAREQPLILAITTAGWNKESVAYEHREYARKIAEGGLEASDFLGVVYSAPEDADWTVEETWKAANPSLGWTTRLEEYREKCAEAQAQPSAQNAFRTLLLSQWVGQADRVIPMDAWDKCNAVPRLQGAAFGGLDLASTTDLTAFVLAFWDDPYVDLLPWFFIPGDKIRERSLRDHVDYEMWANQGLVTVTPGSATNYSFVKQTIMQAADDYEIDSINYDRWGAHQLAQELEDEGVKMAQIGQGFGGMSAPTKELLRLVVDGKVRHGGNPVLRWNADNAAAMTDPAGNLKPAKDRSAGRIDGIVASIMAIDGLMRGANVKKRVSVYESRGLVTG